jgi:uncharacterized protein (TIRG00374 family)
LKFLLYILGFLLGGAGLWLSFRGIELAAVWTGLREASPAYLMLGCMFFGLNILCRVERWRLFFPKTARPGRLMLLRGLMIGYLINNIVPARAGDLARGLLVRQAGLDASQGIATVLLERVLDFFLVCLVAVGCAGAVLPEASRTNVWWMLLLTLGVMVFFLVVTRISPNRWRFWLNRLPQKLAAMADSVRVGLGILCNGASMAGFWGITIALWLFSFALLWALNASLGISASLWQLLIIKVAIVLSSALPGPPGQIGVLEGAAVLAGDMVGMGHAETLSLALLWHGFTLSLLILGGVCCLPGAGKEWLRNIMGRGAR